MHNIDYDTRKPMITQYIDMYLLVIARIMLVFLFRKKENEIDIICVKSKNIIHFDEDLFRVIWFNKLRNSYNNQNGMNMKGLCIVVLENQFSMQATYN